jgi:hypothetical protein
MVGGGDLLLTFPDVPAQFRPCAYYRLRNTLVYSSAPYPQSRNCIEANQLLIATRACAIGARDSKGAFSTPIVSTAGYIPASRSISGFFTGTLARVQLLNIIYSRSYTYVHNLAPMSNIRGIGPDSEEPRSSAGLTVCWIRKSAGSTSGRVVCRSMALDNVKYPLVAPVSLSRSPYAFTRMDPVRKSHCESRSRLPLNVEHDSAATFRRVTHAVGGPVQHHHHPPLSNWEIAALTGSGGSQRVPRSLHPTYRFRAVFDRVDTALASVCITWPGAPRSMAIPSPVRCEFLRGFC